VRETGEVKGAGAKRGTHGLRKRCPLCKKLRKFREPPGDQSGEDKPRRPKWTKVGGRWVCGFCSKEKVAIDIETAPKGFNPFTNMEPNIFQVDMTQPIPAVAQDFDDEGPLGEPRLVDLRRGYVRGMTPREMLELRMSLLPFAPFDISYRDTARRDPVSNFFGGGR